MTNKEAIKQLNEVTIYHQGKTTREALDLAIEALEKQIPKKPKGKNYCSACGDVLTGMRKYCGNCGQAIDRSEEDEKDEKVIY